MLVVTEMHTSDVKIQCPYCGVTEGGFCVDPRGHEFECDECSGKYLVHSDADLEFY